MVEKLRFTMNKEKATLLLKERGIFLILLVGMLLVSGVSFGSPVWFILFICAMGIVFILLPKRDIALNSVILILFTGGIFTFATPILDSPDEIAHFARAMRVSQGDLLLSKDAKKDLITEDFLVYLDSEVSGGKTFRNNKLSEYQHSDIPYEADPIRATGSYGGISYLPSGIGFAVGKVLNLNLMWSFYLGRLMNLIVYGLFCYFAVKKSKHWQQLMAFFCCFPMSVYLAASYNQDGFSIGLGLLIIGEFITMIYKENKITIKDLLIYLLMCLVMVTSKLPYCLLICLPFFIPRKKFENKKTKYFIYVTIALTAVFVLVWFKLTSGIVNVHRALEVNEVDQVKHILKHPLLVCMNIGKYLFINVSTLWNSTFTFGWLSYGSQQAASLYFFVFGGLCLFWPTPKGTPMFSKIGALLISGGIIFGICLSMYVTWTAPGSVDISGVQGRYFIILFPLLPLFMNVSGTFLSNAKQNEVALVIDTDHNEKLAALLCSISYVFIAMMLFCTVARYGL